MSNDDVVGEVIERANALAGRIWGHFAARVAELGLSGPEAKALIRLQPDQPLSMRELAAGIHASPSNVTVTVVRLEARGLVHREGGDDRRVRSVRLTEKGADLRRHLEERLTADHPALHGLDPEDQTRLLTLLRQLTP